MPFLTLTNNQRILENQYFIVIPALALKQPRMTHKARGGGGGGCKSESPRWIVTTILEHHLPRISWFSDANACHAYLYLLLLSGLAIEARQMEFEQGKLSSLADCMEYFMK